MALVKYGMCLLVSLALVAFSGCSGGEDDETCPGGAARCIRFPEDAAPHEDRTEWWYYTGHLNDGDSDWGFQVTIFQFRLETMLFYMCHVALIDEEAGEHLHVDTMEGYTTTWTTAPIELEVSNCLLLIGGDGRDRIVGTIPEGLERDGHVGEWSVDLDLEPTKDVTFHGDNGIISMSPSGGESWYYSYTRLAASGTLTTPEGTFDVEGQAWMDHQWGDFDVHEFKGWDWWSMQLEDGWEIMLFQFRDWDSVLVSQAGTIIDAEGNATYLDGLDDFTVTPLREWDSPHTDGVYPLDWDIAIGAMDWQLQVTTDIDDQEMYNPAQNYWEGPVSISGTRGEESVSGVGFVELTGYATDQLDPE